jgi:hypothetical protein
MPVNFLHTVRCTLPREIMPLHHTGVAATLTGPDNINTSNLRELLNSYRRTDLQIRCTTKLSNKPLRLTTSLLNDP